MRGPILILASLAAVGCSQPARPSPAPLAEWDEAPAPFPPLTRPDAAADAGPVNVELEFGGSNQLQGLTVDAWFAAYAIIVEVRNVGATDVVVDWDASTITTRSGKRLGSLMSDGDGETLIEAGAYVRSTAVPASLVGRASERAVWGALDGGELALSIWRPKGVAEIWTAKIHRIDGGQAIDDTDLASMEPTAGPPKLKPGVPSQLIFSTKSGPRPSGSTGSSSTSRGCVRGCPCGNSCISCAKTCRK